jgi:hypothetical protein
MVYNVSELDASMKRAIEKADVSGDGHLNFEEFTLFTAHQPELLQPVFAIKETLQVACFGHKFWKKEEQKREKLCVENDLSPNERTDIKKIIYSGKQESKLQEEDSRKSVEEQMAQRHEAKVRKKEEKQKARDEKAQMLSDEQFADWKTSKSIADFPALHQWKDAVYDGEYASQMATRMNDKIKANDHGLSKDEHFEIVKQCARLKKKTVDAQNRADVAYATIHAHMNQGLNQVGFPYFHAVMCCAGLHSNLLLPFSWRVSE